MAKYIYTCFACGFPFVSDAAEIPLNCPSCGALPEEYLREPWTGDIRKRRIHVDPPPLIEKRDPFDINSHIAKDFAHQNGHGRVRQWVMVYDEPEITNRFYEEVFGWDIIQTGNSNYDSSVYYCATGPGTKDWQPNVPSFIYGFLIKRREDMINYPPVSYVIEIKDIDEALCLVEEYGGKTIRPKYQHEGENYALIEDTEGNVIYLWEVRGFLANSNCGISLGRPPKKFPCRSLHGRTRILCFTYKNFRRMQRFYIKVFGWDFARCAPSIYGTEAEAETPCVVAATGPAQASYEGLLPGYANALAHYTGRSDGTIESPGFLIEVDMDTRLSDTLDKIVKYGGRIILDKSRYCWAVENPNDVVQSWAISAVVEDPAGNPLYLWKCPRSRTWEEPETGYDGPDGIIYG